MAIVSAIALLVALGLAALLSLQPWAANSVTPQLSIAPGLGIGLGDSVVVARNRQLAVAPAQPATGATPRFIAAGAVVDKGESQPRLGIAAARVVASPRPGGSKGSPEPPQPEPMPAPQPSPVPVAVPVAAPPPPAEPVASAPVRGTGGEEMPGPIAGGGAIGGGIAEVLQVCEGDDYTLSPSPMDGTEGGEALPSIVRHDLTVYFGSSNEGAGFYLVLFDGQPIEIGDDPVLLEPSKSCAQIDPGPLLGESIEAGTEIHVEAVTLGEALDPVVP